MKNILTALTILIALSAQAFAHSGRTDKNGGHNCSQKSKEKGLCTGYHYHNNGSLHVDATDEEVDPTHVDQGSHPTREHSHSENMPAR
ncbi:YHYH domain-containing protein [Emcibacter sp.]|uniref:YHYH domain-containing protein n=1 Tax=Emcibacter sp. TaxID=1979954 RepID=UPI002AA81DE1|nr:YHYH domain-containing protein [Emcibacter sp.]